MTSLLIHNNKTNVTDIEYTDNISFLSDTSSIFSNDIDSYISDFIDKQINIRDFDILIIKDNLSSNYLDFYGLLLAYHIRLTEILKEKRYVPIVIISDINTLIMNKLSDYGRILFTQDVYISKNEIDSIKHVIDIAYKYKKLNKDNFLENFLLKIEVKKTLDYLSNHAISNEWSVYRWSKILKVSTDDILEVEKKISFMLYFKYLKNLYLFQEKTSSLSFSYTINKSGKVLYIDDEWDKGWNDVLENFFKFSPDITYSCVKEKFKDKTSERIVSLVRQKIIDNQPDIVILDLRLSDEDFQKNVEMLSGMKLLKEIKDNINKGIQVIIFTASQNSLILEELFKYGITGYIKKEHPENYTLRTIDNIKKLKKLVHDALDRRYLREIFDITTRIKTSSNSEINIIISSIFDLLDHNISNKYYYTMLSVFKCLEILKDEYIRDFKFKDDNSEIDFFELDENSNFVPTKNIKNQSFYESTCNSLHNILYHKLDLKDKSSHVFICEISRTRNNFIHPENGKGNYNCSLLSNLTSNQILIWVKMLEIILNKYKSLNS